jgi:hypothetical protein
MSTKKIYIIIAVLVGVLLVLIVVSNLLNNSNKTGTKSQDSQLSPTKKVLYTSPTPVRVNTVVYLKPRTIDTVPTLIPEQGQGLDLHSPEIQKSELEIKKALLSLPYNVTFTTEKNIHVEIMIPTYDLQENPWTLTVHIFGPDYQVAKDSVLYADNKAAFREAVNEVYYWLKSKDIKTEDIIIKWGDRQFIQQRSLEWLE